MFDARYMDALLSGEKKLTIRLAGRRIPRRGEIVYVYCGGYVLGRVIVREVLFKPLSLLTDEEACLDGFRSRDELVRRLKLHYPDISDDSLVALIFFEWVEKFGEPIHQDRFAWGDTNPLEVARLGLDYLDDLSMKEREVLSMLIKERSIRAVARKLGGLGKRLYVRRILRKVYLRLREKGVL